MYSSFKRRNEEDSQLTSNLKTMRLEDHLSQLPDDCLLDILPRLNHNDLDEVSTLCDKMRILSDLSRTKAAKNYAHELRVIQVTNEHFIIEIYTKEGIYFIDNSNHYDISERMKMCTERHEVMRRFREKLPNATLYFPLTDDRPQTQIISEIVADRIIALLDRFDFEITTFEGLSIDNHIVRCIEQLSTSRSIRRVGMNECAVDVKLTPEGRTRFLSTLLAIKPAFLFFWCDSICIDDIFIKEYADTVPSADFHFCDDDDFAIIEPDENIWKFKTLGIVHMVVEVHWILPQIWKRLHENMDGTWWFSLTRPLILDDLENYLPTNVQKTFWISDRGEVIFIIEMVGTIHKAILCPIYEPIENRPEWTLKVHFFSFNSFTF